MAAIRCITVLAALLGVDERDILHLDVKSSNDDKFTVTYSDGSQSFVKLCSFDELERTLDAIAMAPEQVLPVVDTIDSHQDGHRWVSWPLLAKDGFEAVTCEPNLELAWLRFKDCLYVLATFHANTGSLHGDCKLENFMFDSRGRPWLIDFECFEGDRGMADSICLGTPAFAAPECWRDRCGHAYCEAKSGLDETADVYSLAASFLARFHIKPAAGVALDRKESLDGTVHSCPNTNHWLLSEALQTRKRCYPGWEGRLEWLLQLCNPDIVGRYSSAQAIRALRLLE